MKRLMLSFILLIALVLAACVGNEVEDKEVSSVETGNNTENTDTDTNDTEDTNEQDKKEFNETIMDNDQVKAVMTGISKIENKDWNEEKYEIYIEIENKRDDTIEVQSREVSIDDVMVDDMVAFSETVASGKKANAKMSIENYDGELPEMHNNIEFILHVFSHDDYEYEDNQDVKVEF